MKTQSLSVVCAMLVLILAGCGGKPSPDKAMLGKWEMNRERTEKLYPDTAKKYKQAKIEINADGTASVALDGEPQKYTWKEPRIQGESVLVNFVKEGGKDSEEFKFGGWGENSMVAHLPKEQGAIAMNKVGK